MTDPDKQFLEIEILGCGDTFDPVQRNTSFLLRSEKIVMLIDCGYQTATTLFKTPELASAIDSVFITHHHADHLFGLPILLGFYVYESLRKEPLTIFGAPGIEDEVRLLSDHAFPGALRKAAFDLRFCEVRDEVEHGQLTLRTAPIRHNIPAVALSVTYRELTCGFSGDGVPQEETLELYSRCQYLFHECYSLKSLAPEHSNFETLLLLLQPLSRLEHLYLVHIRSDERRKILQRLSELSELPFRISVPLNGEQLRLPIGQLV